MLIDLVEAVQHCPEVVWSDGQHCRKTDCRVHGVASSNPVPETEHVRGIDTEFLYSRRVRRHSGKVFGDRLLVTSQTGQRPSTSRVGVRHRLQRREGFRGNDKEGLRRVQIADSFSEVRAINIGNETECRAPLAVMLQRFVCHDRSEVGAADADVDDVANWLAGLTFPFPAPDAIGEIRHLIENGLNLRNYVLAVDYDGGSSRYPQGHV